MIDANVSPAAVMRRRREIIGGGRQLIYYSFGDPPLEKPETADGAKRIVDADLATLEANKEQQRDV